MAESLDDFGATLVTPQQIERFRAGRQKTTNAAALDVSVEPLATEPRTDSDVTRPVQPPRRQITTFGRFRLPRSAVLATLVLLAGVWASTGFYQVAPDQKGIVLRFGQWVDTRASGLNYHWPYPIETVLLPRVTQLNQLKLGNGSVTQMLTGDENIVEASASVSWRIRDAGKYLFNVEDPDETVRVAGESAIKEVIALNPIQSGLSDQREKIAEDVQALLQKVLDSYDTGITITQVRLERVDPPAAVIDAFNDVQRARADQERVQNEAEAYANDILPRARGEAARLSEEANAYKALVVNQAEGDAKRFQVIHDSYLKAPDVTIRRLYLDTMEDVLKTAGKIVVNPPGQGASSVLPVLSLSGAAPVPTTPQRSLP